MRSNAEPSQGETINGTANEHLRAGGQMHCSALGTLRLAMQSSAEGVSQFVLRTPGDDAFPFGTAAELLHREQQVLAGFSSPYVPAVHGLTSSPPGTLRSYIDGVSLAEVLHLASAQAGRFCFMAVIDVLRALQSLHTRTDAMGPTVHQAPTPRHIIVGVDGIARLIDFTQAFAPGLPWTPQVLQRIRPSEMAPEHALAPARVDTRCDLYIAGLTLYQVLTGQPLARSESAGDPLQRLLRGSAPTLIGTPASHLAELDFTLARVLARTRTDRLSSAGELADELQEAGSRLDLVSNRQEIGDFVRQLQAQSAARLQVATPSDVETLRTWKALAAPESQTLQGVGSAPLPTDVRQLLAGLPLSAYELPAAKPAVPPASKPAPKAAELDVQGKLREMDRRTFHFLSGRSLPLVTRAVWSRALRNRGALTAFALSVLLLSGVAAAALKWQSPTPTPHALRNNPAVAKRGRAQPPAPRQAAEPIPPALPAQNEGRTRSDSKDTQAGTVHTEARPPESSTPSQARPRPLWRRPVQSPAEVKQDRLPSNPYQ
jgi:hypothetical protein